MRKLFVFALFVLFAANLNGCVIWDDCDGSCGSSWSDCDGGCGCGGGGDIHYDSCSWEYECSWDWGDYECDWEWVCTDYDYDHDYVDPVDHTTYARACIRDSSCYDDEVCVDNWCVLKSDVDNDTIPVIKPECVVNADCADDMICTDNRCIPCQTDLCDTSKEVECVFSSQCESGLCVDGACLSAGSCAIDANCGDGFICVDKVCIARPECLNDAECGDGKICNASNECEDDVECRIDSDCGEGLICVANMCAQCRLSCECPNEGDVCMNGACVADDRVIKN